MEKINKKPENFKNFKNFEENADPLEFINESGNIDLASFNTIKSFKAEKRCALTEKNRLDDKKNQFLVENCKNEELCNKNENLNLSAKSDKNLSLLEKRNPNLCLSEKKNKSLAL